MLKKIWNKVFGFLFFTGKEIGEIKTLFKETEGLIGKLETISNTETRKVLFEKFEPHKKLSLSAPVSVSNRVEFENIFGRI